MPELVHIEVTNPDDPMGMPAFGGTLAQAPEALVDGEYRAYVHYSDGDEGYAVLTVTETAATLRPIEDEDL